MHSIIEKEAGKLPSVMATAKKQKEGYLYLIDLRTPEGIMGNVLPEDIIGAFKVENGVLVNNSYQRNRNHKVFTKNGLMKLPEDLLQCVVAELKKLK